MENNTKPPVLTREEILVEFKRLQMYRRTAHTLDGAAMHIFRPKKSTQRVRKFYRKKVKHRKHSINVRMREKGMECQLSYVDIILLLQDRTCFYTDRPMKEGQITFDRVDNNYGYDVWNVVTCHKDANITKSILFEDSSNPEYLGPITDFTLEFIKTKISEYLEK